VPRPLRHAAARIVANRRAAGVERELAALVRGNRPIALGPWLGEVGFELLYWIPFLRWFAERYEVPRERLIAVSRGGAGAWYASFAGRSHDALAFMSAEDFRVKNRERSARLGEQKQIALTPLEGEILDGIRHAEARDLSVLHPSAMYRLFAPYWWGHRPIAWIRQYARFAPLEPPPSDLSLPPDYTAVKFYFNDCFGDTPEHRAFVDRTMARLAGDGPVISLSTGIAVDDHAPCDPELAAVRSIRRMVLPESNLAVQSVIVGRARRFVGTYGGFAYLAPLCGVPATTYFTDPDAFSRKHLDLVRDVLQSRGRPDLLEVVPVPGEEAQ
jgi:hypothetical protein